jgi:hypothetical protein
MGKRLKSYVHVHDEAGETHVYGPQDDVPAEHADLIGDHAWVDDDEPVPDNRPGVVVENTDEPSSPRLQTGRSERSGGSSKSSDSSGGSRSRSGGSSSRPKSTSSKSSSSSSKSSSPSAKSGGDSGASEASGGDSSAAKSSDSSGS